MDSNVRIDRVENGKGVDYSQVLQLFDAAISWLGPQGRTGQWGSEPRSSSSDFRGAMDSMYAKSTVFHAIGTQDGQERIVGAMLLATERSHPETIPAPSAPALHVELLITDRSPRWRGLGGKLMQLARQECATRGVHLLRVDCFGGEDGKLVRAYENMGFVRSPHDPIMHKKKTGEMWPMQILEMWL